jgi:hypothetical protein
MTQFYQEQISNRNAHERRGKIGARHKSENVVTLIEKISGCWL